MIMKLLKTLRIIHVAVLVEALVFFAVAFILNRDAELAWMNEENPDLFLIGLVLIVISSMGAFIVPRIMLNSVRSKESKEERLKAYSSVAIIRMALLDAAMTMSIVFFIVDKAWIYVLILSLLILIFLSMFPTQQRIERDSEMSIDDFSEDEFND